MRMPNANREGGTTNDAAAASQFLQGGFPVPLPILSCHSDSHLTYCQTANNLRKSGFLCSSTSHNCSLSQVVRDDGLLRGVQQGDPCLRDGDAGADQRLPPGVLRLPAVQPQVRDYLRIGDRPFPITSINCRTPKGTPSLPPAS